MVLNCLRVAVTIKGREKGSQARKKRYVCRGSLLVGSQYRVIEGLFSLQKISSNSEKGGERRLQMAPIFPAQGILLVTGFSS